MEENQTEENSVSTKTSTGSKSLILVSLAILVVLLVGGFMLVRKNSDEGQSTVASSRDSSNRNQDAVNADTNDALDQADNDGDSDNLTVTPSNINSNETASTNENTSSINVEGGMYYFKPDIIKAKKNEPVKIVFTNAEGFHDFVIDDLNINSGKIKAGESKTIEFTPGKTGSFEFYCSVADHRQRGMKGTLVVE